MLTIAFALRAGRVELTCDPEESRNLQTLRARFSTSEGHSLTAFTVDIDDFLVSLRELVTWPDPAAVIWHKDILALVEGNGRDSATVGARLQDPEAAVADLAVLDGRWDDRLTPFQRRDLASLAALDHGANFSVPGAGKTRVSLALFDYRRRTGRVRRMLVVCPKSAYESWTIETAECFGKDAPALAVLDGPLALVDADILLVNYERLPDALPGLLAWIRAQPTLLVLDEAHRMKRGPAGVWGAACLTLGPYAAARLILSGTPAPNGARDLENLMAFVWPGLGRQQVTSALGDGDLTAASRRLKPLYVRTSKAQLGLPPMDVAVRRVPLPPLHREIYQALLGQAAAQWIGESAGLEALGRVTLYLLMAATSPALLATGGSRYEPLPYRVPPLSPPPDSCLADLMRDLPQYELAPKFQEALSIVAANASAGRKTLVWSTFVRGLTSMDHLMRAYNPAMVHGGTVDREGQIARFRSDPECMVLLANPATLGEGVSLHHECHDSVYIDRDFAAGRFMQSLDRIHRLGLRADTQTRVTVLCAEGTIDELVESRLSRKLDFMGTVLDDAGLRQLADLDEEATETVGMDARDVEALVQFVRGHAAA